MEHSLQNKNTDRRIVLSVKLEVTMARENLFKQMEVIKGYHYCMFCDSEADFVITNSMVSPRAEYPMCKKCAELFKGSINIGLEMK